MAAVYSYSVFIATIAAILLTADYTHCSADYGDYDYDYPPPAHQPPSTPSPPPMPPIRYLGPPIQAAPPYAGSSFCGGWTTVSTISSNNARSLLGAQPDSEHYAINPSSMHLEVHPTVGKAGKAQQRPMHHRKLQAKENIRYNGGRIMGVLTTSINLYHIFYGTWAEDSTTLQVINHFAANVGCSNWFKVNREYHDNDHTNITAAVRLTKSIIIPADQGSRLVLDYKYSPNNIPFMIMNQINLGNLPADFDNGIYVVMTSADIIPPDGMCEQYCGWHTYVEVLNRRNEAPSDWHMKFAFLGNQGYCGKNCTATEMDTEALAPNHDLEGDQLASIYGHELVETISDPELDAWYDDDGNENADKCAWDFGDYQFNDDGSVYNTRFSGKTYFIQQNWSPKKQKCRLYP